MPKSRLFATVLDRQKPFDTKHFSTMTTMTRLQVSDLSDSGCSGQKPNDTNDFSTTLKSPLFATLLDRPITVSPNAVLFCTHGVGRGLDCYTPLPYTPRGIKKSFVCNGFWHFGLDTP